MTAADLAATLRDLRVGLGISQEQAAARLGIRRSAVSEIERGNRRVSAEELAAFAALYLTTADALLAGHGVPAASRCRAAEGMVTVPRAELETVLAGFRPLSDGENDALKRLLDIVEPS